MIITKYIKNILTKEKYEEYYNNYGKHFFYKIGRMYVGMKVRTKKFNYGDIISKENFVKFIFEKSDYIKIYKQWVDNNYSNKLIPSIDRINCYMGYIEGNLQIITLSDNCVKSEQEHPCKHASIRKKVMLISIKDNSKMIFNSGMEACKFLGLYGFNRRNEISGAIRKGWNVKGYKAYYIDNNNEIILSEKQQERLINPPNKNNAKKVKIIRRNEEYMFNTVMDAINFIGIHKETVYKCNGNHKTIYGYFINFRYKNHAHKNGWHIIFIDKLDIFYSLYPEYDPAKRKELINSALV